VTRAVVLDDVDVRRLRRDPRFRLAMAERIAEPGWRSRGLCLHLDPELFFPSPTEDPGPALQVCGRCPVRGSCLAAALDAGDGDGVWGGTTVEERRAMRAVWVATVPRA
jgi:WhiB family redox-sensing transcriptional regulator